MVRCLPKTMRFGLVGTALLVPLSGVPMGASAQVTYAPRSPDQPPAAAAPADPAPTVAVPSDAPPATVTAPPAVAVVPAPPAPPATIEPAQPTPTDVAPAAPPPAAAAPPAIVTPTPAKVGEVLKDVATGDVKALRRGPLLIHGNYCGIGNRPGKEPTDPLDAACMRHDACTDEHSLPSCACDNRLRREALAIAEDPTTRPDIKALATTMAASMVVLICK